MPLPPEVEAKLASCKAEVAAMRQARLDNADSIDELLSQGDIDAEIDAIPDETFDDPSIVRAVERLEQRVKRSSVPPLLPAAVRAGSR